jgi:hypothetical protein
LTLDSATILASNGRLHARLAAALNRRPGRPA